MNVREAAELIGIHPSHLRRLIRAGQVAHTEHFLPDGRKLYTVTRTEAERVRDNPPAVGRPRGGTK